MKKTKSTRHTAITHPVVMGAINIMAENPDYDFSPMVLQGMLWSINVRSTDSSIGRRLRDLADMGYVSKRRAYDSKGRFYRTYRITGKGCRACLLLK